MRRWWLSLALILVILLGAFGGWLRVDRYLAELWAVREIPQPLWQEAYHNLSDDSHGVRGILARVTPSGIWLWRGWRPYYVATYDNTVYSYWRYCGSLADEEVLPGETFDIPRSIFADSSELAGVAVAGQLVEVHFAQAVPWSVAQEVYVYDWRVYIPSSLEQQCAG